METGVIAETAAASDSIAMAGDTAGIADAADGEVAAVAVGAAAEVAVPEEAARASGERQAACRNRSVARSF